MSKRSTNFGGWRRWRRGGEAENILAAMRALGMSDDEIRQTLLKMKTEMQKKEKGKE